MNTSTSSQPVNKLALTTAYYLSIFILGLFTAVSGPALPSLAENTSSTLDQISLFFVLGALGYLLGSYFGGQAYDRFPGNRIMAATLLVIAISGAFVPILRQLWLLLLAQFMLGLAQGANDVGCNTLLLWVHHDKGTGPYINGLHFFFGLGAFIAPLVLAGMLSLTGGIQWVFWIFALLSLPLIIWFWNLPEPRAHSDTDANGRTPMPLTPVILLVLAFLLYVGAEVGFGNWIYTYALTLGLGTAITSAYLTSAFWGTFTVGRLLGIWISTHLRSITILFVDLVGCLASLGVIMLWGDSTLALWAGSIGLGLFMASVFPTTLVLAGERMNVTGSMTGWFLVGGGIGGMTLPWVIGQAFVGIGAGAMPVLISIAVALNLLSIAVFIYLPVKQPQSA
ncbi:MAG: MFS transporter [Anaerolineales bacterium]|jgi:FHS family Na+ dependent glucose MFS transporter 1